MEELNSVTNGDVMKNTETQRHKGAKMTGDRRSFDSGHLCIFAPLCLCVSVFFIATQATREVPAVGRAGNPGTLC
jgi:hypothetical protein